MKRKMYVILMSFALTASMTCGCGNKPNQSIAAEPDPATVEQSSEPSKEEEPSLESQPTAEPDEMAEATPTPVPEPTEMPEPVSDTPESVEETEKPEESATPTEQTTAATPAPAETPAPETETPDAVVSTEPVAYTVTDMSATMYAKNAVNLRQGPGTEYAKVGNLTKGQQVAVTGQAANGWYQLDNGAFVSNKYLSDIAPAQQTVATTPAESTEQVIPVDGSGVITNTPYVANATEFFNYLNQQRSAVGLGTLTWDDGMAAVAQRRAQELATNYSHDGNVEMYGENIHNSTSGSYVDWYNSFYNSTAHRETMMTPNYGRGAAAVYFDGYKYYVVSNFAGIPLTADQLIEQAQPDNLIPAGGNESGTTNSFSTTGETLDPNNPDDAEIWNAIKNTQDQLNNGEIERVYD